MVAEGHAMRAIPTQKYSNFFSNNLSYIQAFHCFVRDMVGAWERHAVCQLFAACAELAPEFFCVCSGTCHGWMSPR
jgi:hypothetical protein